MIELALLDLTGTWEHIGDYPDIDAATAVALEFAEANRATLPLHRGVAVFGASADAGSGHYETRIEVHADGSHSIA